MSQHDMNIANQSRTNFRTDLNNALAALVSHNSGATEPTTTFAYMLWADTTNGYLKMRNAANSAWIQLWLLSDMSASATEKGIVELATDAETITGTDAVRAVTPANVSALNYAGKFFEAYMSAAQSINPSTTTLLQMDTETFDASGVFDNSAGNYKVVIPNGEAWFLYGRAAVFNAPDMTTAQISIYKNGGVVRDTRDTSSAVGDVVPGALTGIIVIGNGTDYYQMYFWHNSGSALNTLSGATKCYFGGFKIK